MNSHDLARKLLAGPDLPVYLSVDDQYGLLSQAQDPEDSHARPWDEDPDYMASGEDYEPGSFRVIVLSPERQG